MEEVFQPVTENRKQNQSKQELSEEQIQALRDSTHITIHMPVRTSRILLVRFLSNQSANIFFGSFTLFSHYAH